jgi:glycosyltransferase involved in cell wall biosynthesis
MKKLILFYPSFERGGVKRNFLNFVNIVKSYNFETHIITDKKIDKKFLNKKIILHITKNNMTSFLFHKFFSSFISVLYLINLLLKNNSKDKAVYSFQSSFLPAIVCFFFRTKFLIRVSEDPLGATKYADERLLSSIVFLSKIITYNLSTKIIVNAKMMQKNVQLFLFNKSKVHLVYNSVINKILDIKKKRKNIFLNVGRLCKQKNQISLIKAFYYLNKLEKNYELIICGDGPDRNKLKRLCHNLGISKKVKFYGWVKNLSKVYKESKFFVLTSLYEGLPNALIDARNYGLVCLSTNVSGAKDILNDNSLIIKNNDIKSIYKKMNYSIINFKHLEKKNKTKTKLNCFLNANGKKAYKKILAKLYSYDG